ncbi:hypothetical protein KM043_002300 [Ampulex compressa]|nr:hypothetical protein KM043_002300 [Ampulex compressa]
MTDWAESRDLGGSKALPPEIVLQLNGESLLKIATIPRHFVGDFSFLSVWPASKVGASSEDKRRIEENIFRDGRHPSCPHHRRALLFPPRANGLEENVTEILRSQADETEEKWSGSEGGVFRIRGTADAIGVSIQWQGTIFAYFSCLLWKGHPEAKARARIDWPPYIHDIPPTPVLLKGKNETRWRKGGGRSEGRKEGDTADTTEGSRTETDEEWKKRNAETIKAEIMREETKEGCGEGGKGRLAGRGGAREEGEEGRSAVRRSALQAVAA